MSLSINFNPISLLPSAGIQVFCLIFNNQQGLFPKRSTTTALISILENCYNNLVQKSSISCVFFDITKTYDSIPHEIVLLNLKIWGLISNYISHYIQYSVTNGVCTKELTGHFRSTSMVSTGSLNNLFYNLHS